MSIYELVRLTPVLLLLTVAIGYAASARWPDPPKWSRWLVGPVGPVAAAGVTAVAILVVTGGRAPTPVISDEASYLLQASLFASGQWTAPSPALPKFFEQMHVQLIPTMASKYFPGHAMLLAPGVALGWPWLIPLLLNAGAGALVFLLARRHFGIGVASLSVVLWVFSAGNLWWRASWYSELTSSVLLLGAWWLAGLTKSRGTIAGTIVMVTLLALTRPATAVAVAVPLGFALLLRGHREGRWAELVTGLAVGMVLLGIVPLWSYKTTGDWRETPQARYTSDYMPWDRIGFGLDTTPAMRGLPADHQAVGKEFHTLHAEHMAQGMPRTVAARAYESARQAASGWRGILTIMALVGLWAGGWSMTVPVATVCLQFLLYGLYAHRPEWTLYYLELFPILSVLIAAGIGLSMRRVLERMHPARDATRWLLVTTVGAAACSLPDLRIQQLRLHHHAKSTADFARRLAALPSPSLVFVRYGPDHSPHKSLITNLGPVAAQRVIVAYDRGAENHALWAHYPERTAYLYDQATTTFHRLTRPDTVFGSATTPAVP